MARDLAQFHEIVGDLFQFPSSTEEWERYRLSEDQVAFYHANGYLPGIRILSDEQIEVLRIELSEFFEPTHDGSDLWYEYHSNESADADTVLFHALGAWRLRPGFHDILWHPAFTVAASQLLEGGVRFWHDQLFCKPANHGGVVAWHQDYSYWTRTKPMAHLTCWIGLDDSTRDNGCVHYVPGSHRWDLLPITGLAGDMDAIQGVLTPDQWRIFNEPVAVELKKGECTFHHPLMVHGSFANRTERPRRATVINVFRDGVCSATDETLLEGVPIISKGQKMEGQFFPLLYDPNQSMD
ncbi:MAG: phytanoyl-CoA dioxygenase family protein [Planctomycetaceae bacterium]|nr:phytanoyl-CoA dioxygenase family protein [Planctomycetales bacterium]MCB9923819.1 phytanoyl-CoA dioxygenase family protein [Planctomycetaceae bacterium]